MKFFKLAKTFTSDEDGAVTVDWVVLTAAVVGLGIAVMATVKGGVESLGTDIASGLTNTAVLGADSSSSTSTTTTTE
jgi:Flp pilus assembly pilin Flp